MPRTQVLGADNQTLQAVDPAFMAARVALRPLDYSGVGTVLGHYAVGQKSGATVNIGAGGHVGRVRWAPTIAQAFCVLLRVKVGWIVTSAVTTATPMDFDAIIARGFTVDYNTAITNINMSTVPKTNAMRSTAGASPVGGGPAMASSQMGASGPGICTTAVISGQTSTLDNVPFAIATTNALQSSTATGTAVALQAGTGAPMTTLYECTAANQHPVVLSNLEGVVIREVTAGPTTGTVALYTMWEWAEVVLF